jgi:hypothetical protein
MNRLATLFLGLRALLLATLAGAPMSHAQGPPSADDDAWAAAVAAATPEAYQRYLEEFPAGRYAEDAFRLLIESQLEGIPDAAQGVDIY